MLPLPDAALEHLEQRVRLLFSALKRPDDAVALLDRAEAWWPGATEPRRGGQVQPGSTG
jgi:hypothetical protein